MSLSKRAPPRYDLNDEVSIGDTIIIKKHGRITKIIDIENETQVRIFNLFKDLIDKNPK